MKRSLEDINGPKVVPPLKVVPPRVVAPTRVVAPRIIPPRQGAEYVGKLHEKAKCVFKVLCLERLMTTLNGEDGTAREQLERQTGSKLRFRGHDGDFRDARYQVLGVFADSTQQINGVLEKMVEMLVGLGDEDIQSGVLPGPGWEFASPNLRGQYVFRICVSKSSSGYIIGAGGSTVNQLRAESGAKVFADSRKKRNEQQIRIIGTPDRILACLAKLVELIQQSALEEEFIIWNESVDSMQAEASSAMAAGEDEADESGPSAEAGIPGDARADQLSAEESLKEEVYEEELDILDETEVGSADRDTSIAVGEDLETWDDASSADDNAAVERITAGSDSKDVRQRTGDSEDTAEDDPLADFYKARPTIQDEEPTGKDDMVENIKSTMDAFVAKNAEAVNRRHAFYCSFKQEFIDEVPDSVIDSLERRFGCNIQIEFDAEEDHESLEATREVCFIGPLPNLYVVHLMLVQHVMQLEKDKQIHEERQKLEEERQRLKDEIAKAQKMLAQNTIIGARRASDRR